jgi:UDP-N-acetylmuramoyl-tripeptide--D-alanyl-D-alanine ligase
VAVLGTMLELGRRSRQLHREVLEDALSRPLDLVVAVGGFAEAARELEAPTSDDRAPRLLVVDDVQEAYPELLPELNGGEIVLLKASRGVELEQLVPLLEWDFGEQEGDIGKKKTSAAGPEDGEPGEGAPDESEEA